MAPTIMGRLADKALRDLGSELAASHLRSEYLRECLMDDRNAVTMTLRGGLVEAALVWLQDGKKFQKFSVLAAASKQGSGHIKDCVAGLEERVRRGGGGAITLEPTPSSHEFWRRRGFTSSGRLLAKKLRVGEELKAKPEDAQEEVKLAKEACRELEESDEKKETAIAALQVKLDSMHSEVEEKKQHLSRVEAVRNDLQTKLANAQDEVKLAKEAQHASEEACRKLEESNGKKETAITTLQEKLDSMNSEAQMMDLETKLKDAKEEAAANLNVQLTGTEAEKEAFEQKLEDLKKEVALQHLPD
eukprot:symbB.v1.2.016732.t2/scaffold1271.1/size203481/22